MEQLKNYILTSIRIYKNNISKGLKFVPEYITINPNLKPKRLKYVLDTKLENTGLIIDEEVGDLQVIEKDNTFKLLTDASTTTTYHLETCYNTTLILNLQPYESNLQITTPLEHIPNIHFNYKTYTDDKEERSLNFKDIYQICKLNGVQKRPPFNSYATSLYSFYTIALFKNFPTIYLDNYKHNIENVINIRLFLNQQEGEN